MQESAAIISSNQTFTSWDGTQLFYRTWNFDSASKQALILIHRGHEHSGRLESFVESLNLAGTAAFAFDMRGHGHSPGKRGFAESFNHMVKDLDAFAKYIVQQYGVRIENTAIIANSIGAVVCTAWVHDFAPAIRAMVLVAPAFDVKLYVPLAESFLKLLLVFKKDAVVKSYVKPKMLTHDVEQQRAYSNDPLIGRDVSVKLLLQLLTAGRRLVRDAGAIEVPSLILTSGSDWVVYKAAQKQFVKNLSSQHRQQITFPSLLHALFHEKDRNLVVDKVREFLEYAFEKDILEKDYLNRDKVGFTKYEYDQLLEPPGFIRSLYYGFVKLSMRTVGRLSSGISIGLRTGFDSGTSLDYIYENRACGTILLGRFIDRCYLNAIGWRGIRIRRQYLETFLQESIDSHPSASVRVLDIACGNGRYLLEVLKRNANKSIKACLQDYRQENLDRCQIMAQQLGLKNLEFHRTDAYIPGVPDTKSGWAHIAVVSGLYELCADNDKVLISLKNVAQSMVPNGLLIYTGQPWHPQLEMIARTLTNHLGKPWIMRRRTQAELDALVKAVGLTKCSMRIDPYGIFTVSLARKI